MKFSEAPIVAQEIPIKEMLKKNTFNSPISSPPSLIHYSIRLLSEAEEVFITKRIKVAILKTQNFNRRQNRQPNDIEGMLDRRGQEEEAETHR